MLHALPVGRAAHMCGTQDTKALMGKKETWVEEAVVGPLRLAGALVNPFARFLAAKRACRS